MQLTRAESDSVPPVLLKSGFIVHRSEADPVRYLLGEIFKRQVYTGDGFYTPMPGDVVIDGGANIGIFTLFLFSLQSNLRVFCFEPAARTRARLAANIEGNFLRDKVQIWPLGLYSRRECLPLQPTASSGDTSLFRRPEACRDQPAEEVACISLQEALQLCPDGRIALLKLDIEGAELEVLQGAGEVDWSRIPRIALEYHDFIRPGSSRQVECLLRAYGFDRFERIGDEWMGILRAAQTRYLD